MILKSTPLALAFAVAALSVAGCTPEDVNLTGHEPSPATQAESDSARQQDDTATPAHAHPIASAGGVAASYGLWRPGPYDTCTQEQHDAYSAVGPDGKRYPTWHPPVDLATGCTFGHEHGRDPSTSPLSADGPVLFGFVAEQARAGVHSHRHEDHVGYKVEVANGARFSPSSAALSKAYIVPPVCDVLTTMHQGTHSPDAFTNNLHEQTTRVRCDNGWAFDLQLLSAVGAAGTATIRCPDRVTSTGTPTPPDSPVRAPWSPRGSMGHRFIPGVECVEGSRPNTFEIWKTQNVITAPGGAMAARFAWYWSVSNPSRYWALDGLRRTVDQCYRVVAGAFQVISNPCLTLRARYGTATPIAWDSEHSPFKGTQRGVRLNDFQLYHASGPEVFYTDVLGQNASVTPFPGSVRQYVRNGSYPYPLGGGQNKVGGDFNAPGVHAPN
jgi:hypothetical protein